MKFKIRFADRIVGFFIVLSLACLVFVVVMLGGTQRWFAKDHTFSTVVPTAGGLSKNMPVQYKGFTIGNVKDFQLNEDDNVEVTFIIHEEHKDRVKLGSMVEMMVSPVGLGSQFLFHSGNGEILADGSFLPVVGSAQARELVRQGLADEPRHDDSITVLVSQVSSILAHLDEALGPGSDVTEIGQIMGSLQRTLAGVEELPITVDRAIEGVLAEINPILANVNDMLTELNNPDGLIYTVLDTEKDVYANLVSSLSSVSSMLDSLDKTLAFLPGQLPQIAGLLVELRATLQSADDALVALTNNPLLRAGVPNRLETHGSGTSPRDIRF